MTHICCLATAESKDIPLLSAVLKAAGEPALAILARLDVTELHKVGPDVLVADVDGLSIDPLEILRQLRFVLPNCVMAIYTAVTTPTWSRDCHLAGANGILSKESPESELANGLRKAIQSGCFTDPRIALSLGI
jgi:DNA-binding NarL/FixJ family response regulator